MAAENVAIILPRFSKRKLTVIVVVPGRSAHPIVAHDKAYFDGGSLLQKAGTHS
jgi:hypothetical protein